MPLFLTNILTLATLKNDFQEIHAGMSSLSQHDLSVLAIALDWLYIILFSR